MACTKYRKLINEFLDNEISESEELVLLSHLEDCADCKTYMNNINIIKGSIKETFSHTNINIDLSYQIMGKISNKNRVKNHIKNKNLLIKVAIIAISFILPIMFGIFFMSEKHYASNDDTERLVLEHLEKAQNTQLIHVAYSYGK